MNKIYIDCREHCDTIKQALEEYGFDIVGKQLKLGDFIVPPDTTVERKTVRDFRLSIVDGRLFNQAYRLARFAENPIMIVEGPSFTDGQDVTVSLNAIKGALITLAQSFHLPVLRTRDERDTAWYLKQLFIQRQRKSENTGPAYGYTPKKLNTKKEYVLRAIPGIGTKTAKVLLEHFGSVSNIINASPKELAEVEGLGPKTIDEMQNVLREEQARYNVD